MVQIVHGCKGTTSLVGGVHNFINSFDNLVNRNTANDMIFSVMIAYWIFYLDRKNFVGIFISLISLPAALKNYNFLRKWTTVLLHTLTHTHTQNMVNIFVLANFPHGCRVLCSARSSPFGSVQSILRGSDGMPHIVLQTVEPLLLGSSRGRWPCGSKSLLDKSCHSAAIFETPLGHSSAAPITLYGETSNSPKLFTKLTIKFHIWNHQRNRTTTML